MLANKRKRFCFPSHEKAKTKPAKTQEIQGSSWQARAPTGAYLGKHAHTDIWPCSCPKWTWQIPFGIIPFGRWKREATSRSASDPVWLPHLKSLFPLLAGDSGGRKKGSALNTCRSKGWNKGHAMLGQCSSLSLQSTWEQGSPHCRERLLSKTSMALVSPSFIKSSYTSV